MKLTQDQEIAKKYLEAVHKKEVSFELKSQNVTGYYKIDKTYPELMEMTEEESKSGFGMMIRAVSWDHNNIIECICKEILGKDLYYEIIRKGYLEEWPIVQQKIKDSEDSFTRSFWRDQLANIENKLNNDWL
jgi:hypothetical protein